jgi:hypothetical protein
MQCHFFALGDDLIPVFEAVEKTALHYVLSGHTESPTVPTYRSGMDLPTLRAPAPHPNSSSGYTYLVAAPEFRFVPRRINLDDGSFQYSFDQLLNTRSVCLTHGGTYENRLLLFGRVATVSDDTESVRLHRRFASAIRRSFNRVQAFWVGPEANSALRDGWRLTIGATSPSEFDLALPSGNA